MKASEFDKKFDDGVEDIIDDIDPTSWRRPNREVRRVNVDFPLDLLHEIARSTLVDCFEGSGQLLRSGGGGREGRRAGALHHDVYNMRYANNSRHHQVSMLTRVT